MGIINPSNYYTVQGFMRTELELKGLELQLYAIIYGFSQTSNQYFTGNLSYLCEWTGCTKQGLIKALKSLEYKEYISKSEIVVEGARIIRYKALKNAESVELSLTGVLNSVEQPLNSVEQGVKLSLTQGVNSVEQGVKPSLTTHYNINNNISYNKKKEDIPFLQEIIDYLNGKANTRFTTRSKSTKQHINARIQEGFTLDDFKKVIDNKVSEWYGTDFQKYLCPETLFGTKFEKYLNQQTSKVEQASSVDKYKFVINDF